MVAILERSIWPDAAWCASKLTDDGFPIELGWSSRDGGLRWTSEVAGPELDVAARPDRALALASWLGGAPPEDSPVLPLASRPLRFGAWIGGRHGGGEDQYKIYLENPEVPASLAAWERTLGRAVQWRMSGWTPGHRTIEYYGRAGTLDRPALHRLFGGDIDVESEMIDQTLGHLRARCDDPPLGRSLGVSVGLEDGYVAAVSLFIHPHAVPGRPRDIARRVAGLSEELGGDARVWRALTADAARGRVGLIGLCAARRKMWVQAGWRPGMAAPLNHRSDYPQPRLASTA